MSEAEKKESQKTVVAFISGLLIGGLLVWVFSSTPDQAPSPVEEDTDAGVSVEVNNDDSDDEEETSTESETTPAPRDNTPVVEGEGSISVSNQPAGRTVAIEALELPTANGWVVVRDYQNGVAGSILGAARFSSSEGLMPTSVELLRGTTAGASYQVVFFTNEGGKGFSPAEDTLIEGIEDTFTAQ